MSINNIAFKKEDEKALEVIKEMFRACSAKDIVPLRIKEEEFTCILSISDVDIRTLEHLARKAKCAFEVSTGCIVGTSVSVDVGTITSI